MLNFLDHLLFLHFRVVNIVAPPTPTSEAVSPVMTTVSLSSMDDDESQLVLFLATFEFSDSLLSFREVFLEPAKQLSKRFQLRQLNGKFLNGCSMHMTLLQRLHHRLQMVDLFVNFIPLRHAFQQYGVLLFLFMLVLEQVPVDVDFEIELYPILHFDDAELLIVVCALDEEEQIVWLLGDPHVLAYQLAFVFHFEVELFV